MAEHDTTAQSQIGATSMVAPAGATVVSVPAPPPMPTVSQEAAPPNLEAARLGEYDQVCGQFRALTDIRFKLLSFLPVGTIATVLAAKDASLVVEQAVAAFGLAVTLCVATYNKRNDQLYNELVSRAAELERELHLQHGAFSQRPTTWLSFGPWRIEHGWPIGFIYAASTSLWTYALIHASVPTFYVRLGARDYGPVAPWVGVAAVLVVWRLLRALERRREDALAETILKLKEPFAAKTADQLAEHLATNKALHALFRRPEKAPEKIKARLTLQKAAIQTARTPAPDYAALALVLSNVIDLPARWIHDVWIGRR